MGRSATGTYSSAAARLRSSTRNDGEDAVADRSPRDALSEGQRLLSFLDDEVVVGLVRAVLPPERVGAIDHLEVR